MFKPTPVLNYIDLILRKKNYYFLVFVWLFHTDDNLRIFGAQINNQLSGIFAHNVFDPLEIWNIHQVQVQEALTRGELYDPRVSNLNKHR